MTNENISGFLNSIAEAKRAFDAEPEYQRQIAELERDKQRLGETVASRELRIHQLKQDQETLTAKLRSAEVERDDAGFRALEEADKVQNLLTLMRGFVSDGLKAISAVEGVEQIVVSKPAIDRQLDELNDMRNELLQTHIELDQLRDDMRLAQEQLTRPFPIEGATATSSSSGDTMDPWSAETLAWDAGIAGQGQSAMNPIATTGSLTPSAPDVTVSGQSDGPFAATSPITSLQDVPSTSAENETSAVSSASQTPPERNRDESTRFKGRKYYDVTYFVPLHEWLLKGGTREDYDWRPLPEANRVYSS